MGHYDCKYCDACPHEAHDDDCPRKVAMQADADLERITRERGQADADLERITRERGQAVEALRDIKQCDYVDTFSGPRNYHYLQAIAATALTSIEGAGHEAT